MVVGSWSGVEVAVGVGVAFEVAVEVAVEVGVVRGTVRIKTSLTACQIGVASKSIATCSQRRSPLARTLAVLDGRASLLLRTSRDPSGMDA